MDLSQSSTVSTDVSTATTTLRETQDRLSVATEAFRKSEEHATAGLLALEVMHDIRNPLEALGHLTYLTLEEADNPEKVREYMRMAEEQMSTLLQIARHTLGFAQSWAKPKPMDLVFLAEAAIRIHQRSIDEKKIYLKKDLPEGVVAELYTGEMLQVISNLISNALDAMPADGILQLRVRKRDREVHFIISDNGHGISPDHGKSIFEPFFTTKAERGTGLGLALSKKIVERHHGRIRVRSSVRPGKTGTAFKISLPAA